jgi:hypothetical protein
MSSKAKVRELGVTPEGKWTTRKDKVRLENDGVVVEFDDPEAIPIEFREQARFILDRYKKTRQVESEVRAKRGWMFGAGSCDQGPPETLAETCGHYD